MTNESPASASDDVGFELYDLRVEVVGPTDRPIYCGARVGDYFELHGEMLKLPPGQGFSIYSLAAVLPLLPAKQRMTDPHDWMSTAAPSDSSVFLPPRLLGVPPHQGRLASGWRPRRNRVRAGGERHGAVRRGRHHDLRLR